MVEIKVLITDALKTLIVKGDAFNIICDEADDTSHPGGMVNICYSTDPTKKSKTLACIYIKSALTASRMTELINGVLRDFNLDYRRCNGLYGDSASYVMGSYQQLESLLIFAITFPDPAHLLALPIKGIFDSASSAPSIIKDFFHDVYAFVIETRNFFKNSKKKKHAYRDGIKRLRHQTARRRSARAVPLRNTARQAGPRVLRRIRSAPRRR